MHWDKLSSVRVLVIGDVMVDRYWDGDVSRISPEAPVPVVHVQGATHALGGAGNVAANLAALQVPTTIIGAYGQDEAGAILQTLLQTLGIQDASYVASELQTSLKLRVMGRGQQLIRLDFESLVGEMIQSHLQTQLTALLPMVDIVILSDYKKGVLAEVADLIAMIRAAGKPVLVDPKQTDVQVYAHATMLTPNQKEFEAMVGPCASEEVLFAKAQQLIRQLQLEALLITQGEQGMTLVSAEGWMRRIAAQAQEVYDVTGAGDTVIATLAACLGAGYGLLPSVEAANIAAGIAVRKLGTATVTRQELQEAMQPAAPLAQGVLSEDQLVAVVQRARQQGERIVFTNGCFDILHAGHVRYLQQARAAGDRLIVALNTDASVSRLKGPSRPIHPLDQRAEVIAGLRSVDWVVSFSEETPLRLIQQILPDVLVKGGDYVPDHIVGADVVRQHGGDVRVYPLVEGCSTTSVVKKIQSDLAITTTV